MFLPFFRSIIHGWVCRFSLQALPLRGGRHWRRQGKKSIPRLSLFRCIKCKSTGSTWVKENETPRCGICYEEGVTLLPDNTTHIDCPRCGQPAQFTPKEGSWE